MGKGSGAVRNALARHLMSRRYNPEGKLGDAYPTVGDAVKFFDSVASNGEPYHMSRYSIKSYAMTCMVFERVGIKLPPIEKMPLIGGVLYSDDLFCLSMLGMNQRPSQLKPAEVPEMKRTKTQLAPSAPVPPIAKPKNTALASRYMGRINAQRVMRAYDNFVTQADTDDDLIRRISNETGISPVIVANYIKCYLES